MNNDDKPQGAPAIRSVAAGRGLDAQLLHPESALKVVPGHRAVEPGLGLVERRVRLQIHAEVAGLREAAEAVRAKQADVQSL